MRIAASLAIALGLAASPTARADHRGCEVSFVRAPDEVRLIIEKWLAAEPRCSGTIELRVVETEGGSLYLIAQRPDGRIHEREVPDAQSAGVLVASWVADDWTSTPRDEVESAPAVAPVPASPVVDPPAIVATVPARARATGRWLTVGGMLQTEGEGGFGARFELDLLGGRSAKWTLGIAGAGVSSEMSLSLRGGYGYLETIDLRALLVAARTWQLGSEWNIRWSFGLGPTYTEGTAVVSDYSDPYNERLMALPADGVSMAYESSLTLARELFDHRWAVTFGPAATLIKQLLDGPEVEVSRSKIELMFMLGARYRL